MVEIPRSALSRTVLAYTDKSLLISHESLEN